MYVYRWSSFVILSRTQMSEKRIRSSNWRLIFGVPIAGTSPISDVGVTYPNINLTFSWSSLIWYISPDKYFLGTVLISLFPFPGMMVFLYWRWNNQRSSRWMPEDRSCIINIPHCFLLLLCQISFCRHFSSLDIAIANDWISPLLLFIFTIAFAFDVAFARISFALCFICINSLFVCAFGSSLLVRLPDMYVFPHWYCISLEYEGVPSLVHLLKIIAWYYLQSEFPCWYLSELASWVFCYSFVLCGYFVFSRHVLAIVNSLWQCMGNNIIEIELDCYWSFLFQ